MRWLASAELALRKSPPSCGRGILDAFTLSVDFLKEKNGLLLVAEIVSQSLKSNAWRVYLIHPFGLSDEYASSHVRPSRCERCRRITILVIGEAVEETGYSSARRREHSEQRSAVSIRCVEGRRRIS